MVLQQSSGLGFRNNLPKLLAALKAGICGIYNAKNAMLHYTYSTVVIALYGLQRP